jgi:hypothetical protein
MYHNLTAISTVSVTMVMFFSRNIIGAQKLIQKKGSNTRQLTAAEQFFGSQ